MLFEDIEIEKNKFYRNKTPIFKKDVDIEKVLVSNKIFFGEKKTINTSLVTFIMTIKLNHYIIMLPKTSTYVKVRMDKLNGCIFLIEDNDLLKNHNTVKD